MAMKKVIFTESQIEKLLGSNFRQYLKEDDMSKILPQNMGGEEVTVGEPTIDDTELNAGADTDKLGDIVSRKSYAFGTTKGGPTLAESKKKLNEVNRDFENQEIVFPEELIAKYRNNCNDENSTLAHIIQTGSMKPQTAYKEISDAKMDKSSLPVEIINWLQQNIDTKEQISLNRKKVRSDMGFDNTYQNKTPNMRKDSTKGSGKAHTSKGFNVTFEN